MADEFYVGYLKMPPGHAFYLRLMMPVILWLALLAAALVSSSQFDPGSGAWQTGEAVTLEGMVDLAPYPMIRIPSARLGQPFETILLVQTGKFGGSPAGPFAGQIVSATGWMIERDGRRMLELAPGGRAIGPLADVPPEETDRLRRPPGRALGSVTLRGEIVDAKCFLGVMKPGYGKTHKECATLCIRGGVPPMFVARDEKGTRHYYLLADRQGSGLDRGFLPFVADPVELTGEVESLGEVQILKVDPADIRRL
jgi:hypothetical protein